jgi:hypothetical protein
MSRNSGTPDNYGGIRAPRSSCGDLAWSFLRLPLVRSPSERAPGNGSRMPRGTPAERVVARDIHLAENHARGPHSSHLSPLVGTAEGGTADAARGATTPSFSWRHSTSRSTGALHCRLATGMLPFRNNKGLHISSCGFGARCAGDVRTASSAGRLRPEHRQVE